MPKYCRFHLFSDFSHFMCRDIPWNCWIVGNKLLSLSFQLKCSLRHCRIKKGKETRSFPNRNPFLLYLLSFHWLPERYKILKSFVGIDQFLFFMMWRKKKSVEIVWQKRAENKRVCERATLCLQICAFWLMYINRYQ